MSKKRNSRGDNQAISKYVEKIATIEKGLSHRHLRARALCTHTKEPMNPALSFREDAEAGKMIWTCRICGQKIDLTRISDAKLEDAIATINQACDLIKIMSTGNEKDTKLVEEVIADIQMKTNAYLMEAYKAALNSSNKRSNRSNGRRETRSAWSD
jgi:RNase P subunit RPR2